MLFTRAILRRYSYVVGAGFRSDFQQCRISCGKILKAQVASNLLSSSGPSRTQASIDYDCYERVLILPLRSVSGPSYSIIHFHYSATSHQHISFLHSGHSSCSQDLERDYAAGTFPNTRPPKDWKSPRFSYFTCSFSWIWCERLIRCHCGRLWSCRTWG